MTGYKYPPRASGLKAGSQSGNLPFEQPKHFRIKRRSKLGGGLIFPRPEHHAPHFASFKDCVEWAIKKKISLAGADLTDPYDGYTEKDGPVDLSNGTYDNGDFRDVMMKGVLWCNSSLVSANFSGSYTFDEIKESGYNLHTTEGERADFSGCDCAHAKYDKAILEQAKFGIYHDKKTRDSIECHIEDTSFRETRLAATHFTNAHPSEKTSFENSAPYGAVFTLMDMTRVKDFPLRSGARFFDCQLPMALEQEMQAKLSQQQPKRLAP